METPPRAIVQEHHYELWSDLFHFILRDEWAQDDDPDQWGDADALPRLRPGTGRLEVRTRSDEIVLVGIEVRTGAPAQDDLGIWNEVNECTLDLPSGQLVVLDALLEKDRITLPAGSYRARVYCGDLNRLRDDDLEGGEHYRIALWQGQDSGPLVLKHAGNVNSEDTPEVN